MGGGGYCIEDGARLVFRDQGVWECPTCFRRSAEVDPRSVVLANPPSASLFCDEPGDGSEMTSLRADIMECPRCQRRSVFSFFEADRSPTDRQSKWLHSGQINAGTNAIVDLAVGEENRLWIASDDRSLHILDLSDGNLSSTNLPAEVKSMSSIAIHRTKIAVVDVLAGGVWTWDTSDPGTLKHLPCAVKPGSVCIDSVGTVYVTTAGSEAVLIWSGSKKECTVQPFLRTEPFALAMTCLRRGEDILVLDRVSESLQCWSRTGNHWWSSPVGDMEEIGFRGRIAVSGGDGTIAISCFAHQRVDLLDSIGMHKDSIRTEFLPSAVALSRDSTLLYVGDFDSGCIHAYKRDAIPTTPRRKRHSSGKFDGD